jgi:hypothetical protein
MDKRTEILILNRFENEILELIEYQLRNDDHTLTQSDLQGRLGAIVQSIWREARKQD